MPLSRPASRRRFLKSMFAAGAAPLILPSGLVGAEAPPSGKIGVGVVGTGAQGLNDMVNFLSQDDVRVTAICDVNQRNLGRAKDQIAKVYGTADVKTYTDFREMHADKGVDAVLMALPVHWHSLAALDAIGRGKHIFHEKPMGMSLGESQLVRQAVRRSGVVFQLGTQQRSGLKFRWACELALNGRLGKLKEIEVACPGGKQGPAFIEQPIPDYVDWERWVGPAAMTPFNEAKLKRDNHENISHFSLGMISCWGIHHMDIAQWGNGADRSGPSTIEGAGVFPKEGAFDCIQSWKVRLEFASAAAIVFADEKTPGFKHGIKFIGEAGWVHVDRGTISASDEKILRDPQNKCGTMPVKLPASNHHVRNFLDAIRMKQQPICDIETAVRSDTLCQLSLIAVKLGRKLQWDPANEQFVNDDAANRLLKAPPGRGAWKIPTA